MATGSELHGAQQASSKLSNALEAIVRPCCNQLKPKNSRDVSQQAWRTSLVDLQIDPAYVAMWKHTGAGACPADKFPDLKALVTFLVNAPQYLSECTHVLPAYVMACSTS